MRFSSLWLSVSALSMMVAGAALAQEIGAMSTPTEAQAPVATPTTGDYVVLNINGEEIRKLDFDKMWAEIFAPKQAPEFDKLPKEIQQNILLGLVSERVVYDKAQAEGIPNSPALLAQLKKLERQLVIQTYLDQRAQGELSDDALKAVYDKKANKAGANEELRARHILVATKEAAKEVYEKLMAGEDFAKLAKEKSDDKGSGAQGGDLGWFTQDRMVPEFSKAAAALKVNEISKPIKSDFGFHIIQLQERRAGKAATFEEMKEQLKQEALQEVNRNVVNELLKSSNVKLFDAQGKEQPLPRTIPHTPQQ